MASGDLVCSREMKGKERVMLRGMMKRVMMKRVMMGRSFGCMTKRYCTMPPLRLRATYLSVVGTLHSPFSFLSLTAAIGTLGAMLQLNLRNYQTCISEPFVGQVDIYKRGDQNIAKVDDIINGVADVYSPVKRESRVGPLAEDKADQGL